jgi:hypothetical protein
MGDELRAIDELNGDSRHADYLAYTDPTLKSYIEDAGIHLIGYRDLKAHLA